MFEELSPEFLKCQQDWLLHRLESKRKALAEGTQTATGHLQGEVRRIQFALKRIDQQQYGLCCHCGCPIAVDRLESYPEAILCKECALEHEMHTRQGH